MGISSFLFWRRYLRRPLGIGAIAPSSGSLARAMVVALAPAPSETVVELGPGTGVFTHALLEAGVDRERLILFEFDSEFARHLRMILPGVEVIEADARKLPDILHRRGLSGTPKLLSGLPLRSMPDPVRNEIGRAMRAALLPGGRLVQFTYFAAPPLPADAAAGLEIERLGFIWRNIPPAFVWRYTTPLMPAKTQPIST
jgi:phosphatidylethanolamine/phosphatidyl-N-methylethanolamine N-methyltransferase